MLSQLKIIQDMEVLVQLLQAENSSCRKGIDFLPQLFEVGEFEIIFKTTSLSTDNFFHPCQLNLIAADLYQTNSCFLH